MHSAKKTMHICLDPCPGLLLLALAAWSSWPGCIIIFCHHYILVDCPKRKRRLFALLATPGIGCTRKLHEAAEAKSVEVAVAVALSEGAQQCLLLLRFEQPAYAGNCLVSSIK